MAAQAAASAPALLRPWVGNSRMFGNRMALQLEQSYPFFKNVNNGKMLRFRIGLALKKLIPPLAPSTAQ